MDSNGMVLEWVYRYSVYHLRVALPGHAISYY